ncbi:hypothetical protein PIB30_013021 [Stylosanthes scabra]|uniref:Uncharacterized protein n=1 Tax=Stylosanthes scabra TaxID=79078 RepID=A0ABU6R6G4_9FABA|nr:hypothetical protein [Stylosanthes scabra]
MALVANKSDLEPNREVEIQEGEQFAHESGMFYIETSAKTGENINELFYEIAKRLAKAYAPKLIGMKLNNEMQDRRKSEEAMVFKKVQNVTAGEAVAEEKTLLLHRKRAAGAGTRPKSRATCGGNWSAAAPTTAVVAFFFFQSVALLLSLSL